MTSATELYTKYTALLQKAADINNAAAVLGWDQEVYMPGKGAEFRAQQLATLATMAHEIVTSENYGTLLHELMNVYDLDELAHANVRLSLADYEKNRKLPHEFVDALSRQTSICFNTWMEARKKNDYTLFAPSLSGMIELKKRQADLYGYEEHPYNALLDDYEKGATVSMLDNVFNGIREQLPGILADIKSAQQVSNDCFRHNFPRQQQWDFSLEVLKTMGFDFEAGRQDYSEHPFTTSFAPTDVRITTRVDENNFSSLLWSCIHEGGHGLYEQGLSPAQYGLPLGAAASLGIHESQSRLWENCVGRSLDFWTYFYPRLQQTFNTAFGNISLSDFYKAANKVEPSFIRTEADELTYHFHVMIRYELEKDIITGAVSAKQLPEKWNELYNQYLGITPPDDKTGILQDVHWSHGMFGYFPTYTLGSFYAAQFYNQAISDIPTLEKSIANGEMNPLLQWLREKIHRHGRRFSSEEICEQITGQKLNPDFFMDYAKQKFKSVYGTGTL